MKISKMKIITFGGWYQRTTLHLSEVYRFIKDGSFEEGIGLEKDKIASLKKNLQIKNFARKQGYLEYIEYQTNSGINVKFYEDGLYLLFSKSNDINSASKKIKDYYYKNYKPAIDYLFSKGAPTPKILANVADNPPLIIGSICHKNDLKKINEKEYGSIYSQTESKNSVVSKTKDYIFVSVTPQQSKILFNLIEMQIFFRDFKFQLHKYLNIHRKIWEEISEIKEKKKVRGVDVEKYRTILDSYQKTIQLINNRINQMNSYAKTRASISSNLGIKDQLSELFKYKYEDLFNSLDYIKEIWKMTTDYINSAISIFVELSNKLSSKGLKSIQLLVSLGVIAGILRIMNPGSFPRFTIENIFLIIFLAVIALILDFTIKKISERQSYKLKFIERSEKI